MHIQANGYVIVIFHPTVGTMSNIYSFCCEAAPKLGYEAIRMKEISTGFSLLSHNLFCSLCSTKCSYIALKGSHLALTSLTSTIPAPHNTLLGSGIPFIDPKPS